MKRIYKYPLKLIAEDQQILFPRFFDRKCILSVQEQNGIICLWAMIDDTFKEWPVNKTFKLVGTGWEADEVKLDDYVGTVQAKGFVWHVFMS